MAIYTCSYLDYNHSDWATQKQMIESLKIKNLFIRRLNGKSLIDCETEQLTEIINYLSKNKIHVAVFDPLVENSKLHDEKVIEAHNTFWDKALNLGRKLKAEYIVYRVPFWPTPLVDNKELLDQIKLDLQKTKAAKQKMLLKICTVYPPSIFFHLLKVLPNDIYIDYDPAGIILSKESLVTTFRFFKGRFPVVTLNDFDHHHHPRLLGFGEVGWGEMLKKIIQTDFKGYLVLDLKVIDGIVDIHKKTPALKKLSKSYRQKSKLNYDLSARVGATDQLSIIKYQLKVISSLIGKL